MMYYSGIFGDNIPFTVGEQNSYFENPDDHQNVGEPTSHKWT